LDLLRVAAVAGREFDLRVVAAAAGSTIESILDPLEEAERHRLIAEVPGAVHGYSFSHVLIPEALYAGLSGRQRAQLHRAIGDALEALYPTAPDARLAELAYHFFEAAPGGGDTGKAVAYARRAADHAKGALAYEEAARCYELALTTLARQNVDDEQACELRLSLGEAHRDAANRAASREVYLQAGTLARRLGRPDLLARAALGFSGIIIGIGVDRQAVEVLEEALTALGPQDTGLRAMVLSRLAMELFFSRDAERRTTATADAVATARRAGDPLALVHALEARHFAIWGPHGPAERLALADEMMRSAMAINNVDLVMHAHMLRIHDLLELGLITEVDAAIAAYARLAEELRQPSYQWGLGMVRAMRTMMDGRFSDAEELATVALAVGQRVQPQTAATLFAAQLFHLRRDQGRLAELEPALQGASVAFPKVAGWRCALAGLYAELNRDSEAARELEQAVASGLHDLPRDNSWLVGVTLLAEACAHVSDQRRAALLYEQLLPHDSQVVVVGIASACGGAVAYSLGLLAQALGRWNDAAAHFEHALAMHRRLGARPFVARTQHAYAALLVHAADAGARGWDESYRQARSMVDDADAVARTLGMAALEAKTRALLNRLDPVTSAAVAPAARQPPRSATSQPAPSPSEQGENIFRHESDHWTLIFQGRTCRLKDAKGLRYVALLLCAPHRPMHVAELSGATTPAADAADRETARDRLRDLCAQLEEAEQFNDIGTAARLQAEIDSLTRNLARQFGIESTADRNAAMDLLRLRVTKAIKAALRRINEQHPALGHHLQSTIRTGSFCSYVPDPTKPIRWRE
jgi:tetratricopeptide (TPR) repeat protein